MSGAPAMASLPNCSPISAGLPFSTSTGTLPHILQLAGPVLGGREPLRLLAARAGDDHKHRQQGNESRHVHSSEDRKSGRRSTRKDADQRRKAI